MQLFYHPDVQQTDKEITFPKDESRHMVKVLRKSEGDEILVTNGKGILFYTHIITASANSCVASIFKIDKEKPKDYYLHLAVAPTKMNDRYEWFLEKATEIGIDEITPIICDHSERKHIKPERFERVLLSAMKQSLHLTLPKLNEAINLQDFLKQKNDNQKFIAHCEADEERKPLQKNVSPNGKTTILIGPEGDFSKEEIASALKSGFLPVSLGNSRLRTETAAIVACHTVALLNE